MIHIRSRKKVMKTNATSGNGFSGAVVDRDVVFLLMVLTNVSSNSSSPIIITDTLIKDLPRSLNESCGTNRQNALEEEILKLFSIEFNRF